MAQGAPAAVRRPLCAAVAVALLTSAGCGGSSDSKSGANPNDERGLALECLRQEKKIDARAVGSDRIQVGDEATGPRVRFFLTGGEAEAEQFKGRAEGSEHIGSALLFTRGGSEQQLKQVEDCLANL